MRYRPTWRRACVCAGLAALACSAAAPARADPTRPPAAWRDAPRAPGATAETAATSATESPIRTRIVITGAQRQLAVIDGQLLRPGDRLGDARLRHIETSRLVLSTGESLDPLTLQPLPPGRKRP